MQKKIHKAREEEKCAPKKLQNIILFEVDQIEN